MKWKRDLQNVLLMAGTRMHQLGEIIKEDEQFHEELNHWKTRTIPNLGGSEEGANLETLGIGLVALAKSLSCQGSRGGNGAYDVIPKSQDFFTVSMQWPDRWFRSM